MSEDKTYIGVKIINALPMTHHAYLITEGSSIPDDEDDVEGYQVCYEDGYISWSPAGTFEKSYREIHSNSLPFGHALEAAKLGYCLSRKDWGSQFMFMSPHAKKLRDNLSDAESVEFPYISLATRTGMVITGWNPSQDDMLTDDWTCIGAVDSEVDGGFLMNRRPAVQIADVDADVVSES